jgi:hypothetical protein
MWALPPEKTSGTILAYIALEKLTYETGPGVPRHCKPDSGGQTQLIFIFEGQSIGGGLSG